jgi:hypothetical protein
MKVSVNKNLDQNRDVLLDKASADAASSLHQRVETWINEGGAGDEDLGPGDSSPNQDQANGVRRTTALVPAVADRL